MKVKLPVVLIAHKQNFHNQLLDWFALNQRHFPWRETSDPFKILISEKLLQQTKARQIVIDTYQKLLSEYPTAKRMKNASLQKIRFLIKPLGLSYRAVELKNLSTEIVTIYDGRVPDGKKDLMNITGVGEYTANAVLCFAYKKNVSIVDTNVARFIHRICGTEQKLPANPARKQYLKDLSKELLPKKLVREYNWAIIDLCALLCKPRNPLCSSCPVNQFCLYYNSFNNTNLNDEFI